MNKTGLESFLKEIWPTVEQYGPPCLAFVGGLTIFSVNYYWKSCHSLRKMEEFIKENNTIRGYKDCSIPFIGLSDIMIWIYTNFKI